MNEWVVLGWFVLAGLGLSLIIYFIGYSSGYDAGAEYRRKDIKDILFTFSKNQNYTDK